MQSCERDGHDIFNLKLTTPEVIALERRAETFAMSAEQFLKLQLESCLEHMAKQEAVRLGTLLTDLG